MKYAIVFVALFAVALAAPAADNHAEITKFDSEVKAEHFKFGVATSDGFEHNAEGNLKDSGTDHEAIVVHGSYKYVSDDGKTYVVDYVADENGFQPKGEHIPVA